VLRERARGTVGVVAVAVVSLLQLRVAPGMGADLVRGFGELRIFELAGEHAGLRAARLLEPREPDAPYLVVAEWDRAEDYDAWLAHPERARVNEQLAHLLAGAPAGGLYTVASAWEARPL